MDAQCKAALDFDVIDVPKIGRRLKLAIVTEERAEEQGKLRLLPNTPRFARSHDVFATKKDGAR